MVEAVHVETVAIVIPVYKGEATLSRLVEEIAPLTDVVTTPRGQQFQVAEVILVHDGAVDGSQRVMEGIGGRFAFVRLVWLARNFGQHPATLAGAACSTSDWVVTLDEDGDLVGVKLVSRSPEAGHIFRLPTRWLRSAWWEGRGHRVGGQRSSPNGSGRSSLGQRRTCALSITGLPSSCLRRPSCRRNAPMFE